MLDRYINERMGFKSADIVISQTLKIGEMWRKLSHLKIEHFQMRQMIDLQ